jgi:hypothetical protein
VVLAGYSLEHLAMILDQTVDDQQQGPPATNRSSKEAGLTKPRSSIVGRRPTARRHD